MNSFEKIRIIEYRDGSFSETEDNVTSEKKLKILLNNKEVLSLLCTPTMIRELVVGFVLSEGLIKDNNPGELQQEWCAERIEILWKDREIEVRLPMDLPDSAAALTSGCGKGLTFISDISEEDLPVFSNGLRVKIESVFGLYREFQKRSELFKTTGGVHSAALCNEDEIIVFADDIGRHNAVDKIIGYAFLENIPLGDKILLLSGRLSSEITIKTIKSGIPILVSRAAPTDMSVNIARISNITLIGFLRGQRMNIYSGYERVNSQ